MEFSTAIKRQKRDFLPENFVVTDWGSLEPYFKNLLERKTDSLAELENWLKDMSELEAVISEEGCRRHIRMTCDTENKELEKAFIFFVMEIQPKIQPYANQLNQKLIKNPVTRQLDEKKYFTYLRSVRKSIELFREKNIPIQAELNVLGQQFGALSGKMTIEVNGQEYTLPQASKFLENHDRKLREEVYRKIQKRRLQDKDALNELY